MSYERFSQKYRVSFSIAWFVDLAGWRTTIHRYQLSFKKLKIDFCGIKYLLRISTIS